MNASDKGLPMFVLVGGPMTLEDGSSLDSRQPVADDERSIGTRRGLTNSWLWWSTVSTVVLPMLQSASDDAYALAFGQRTVSRVRPDGSYKRTRLSGLLEGGVTKLSIAALAAEEPLPEGFVEIRKGSKYERKIGLKTDDNDARWRFFDGNDYYLSSTGSYIAPAVIVHDAGDMTAWQTNNEWLFFTRFARYAFSPNAIIVLPHTHAIEAALREYLERHRAGEDDPSHADFTETEAEANHLPGPYVARPPDSSEYAHIVPVAASFMITGVVENALWIDPADMEAARNLVASRYDLKIGFWDLVRNPVLRQTVLDAVPVAAAPSEPASAPASTRKRAAARVAKWVADRETATEALERIRHIIVPRLKPVGWIHEKEGTYWLPMCEPRWDDAPKHPGSAMVALRMEILKRQTSVNLSIAYYNSINLARYIDHLRGTLSDIAEHQVDQRRAWAQQGLWLQGGGWADEIDWDERGRIIGDKTPQWTSAFSELVEISRRLKVIESRDQGLLHWIGMGSPSLDMTDLMIDFVMNVFALGKVTTRLSGDVGDWVELRVQRPSTDSSMTIKITPASAMADIRMSNGTTTEESFTLDAPEHVRAAVSFLEP